MSEHIPLPRARLSLDAEVYAQLVDGLKVLERSFRENCDVEAVNKVSALIGLACLFEIEPNREARIHAIAQTICPKCGTLVIDGKCWCDIDPTDKGLSVDPDADPRPLAEILKLAVERKNILRRLGNRIARERYMA